MKSHRWLFVLILAAGLGTPPAVKAAPPAAVAAADKTDAKEVSRAFARLAKLPDVPWKYPVDGCFARAHRSVEVLSDLGFRPKKVWAFPSGPDPLWVATSWAPKGYVQWGYHVAAALPVKKDGKTTFFVLDPALFDRPVSVREWAAAMKRADDTPLPFTCLTDPGQPPTLPTGKKALGSGYWPGPDPKEGIDANASRTLERYGKLVAKARPAAPATRPEAGDAAPAPAAKAALLGDWVATGTLKDAGEVFTLWRFSADGTFKLVVVGFESAEPRSFGGKYAYAAGSPGKLTLRGGEEDVVLSVSPVSKDKVDLAMSGKSLHLARAGK